MPLLDHVNPVKQAIAGSAIAAGGGVPLWLQVVEGVTSVAGMVAAVCGAVIGICGVWRLIQSRRRGAGKDGGAT